MAYGPLALKPNEFWDLTPREFFGMLDGWRWRFENMQELLAGHAVWSLLPYTPKGKKPPQIWQLLGRPTQAMRAQVKRERKEKGKQRRG